MNKRKVFLTISVIILILGFAYPGIALIYGLALLYLYWSETGGMSYGNPHKKKMLEEGRWAFSRAAYAPIKHPIDKIETSNNDQIWIAVLGLSNIVYAIILIFLRY